MDIDLNLMTVGGGGRSAVQLVQGTDVVTAGGGGGGADCLKTRGCGGGGKKILSDRTFTGFVCNMLLRSLRWWRTHRRNASGLRKW